MSYSITGKDRILVEIGKEEIEVFNHVSVATYHYVNSVNGHETFEPEVCAGDASGLSPQYVTKRIADYLWAEWLIDVTDLGIEVVDINSDEVTII